MLFTSNVVTHIGKVRKGPCSGLATAAYKEVQPGDQFLLCSDGLNRTVPDAEIELFMGSQNGDEIVQSLLHTALTRGAPDNVTIICVECCAD